MTAVQQQKMPIVWTISASAAGGGTGIQADLHTFHDFDVYGCTVVTALCAQNSFASGYTAVTEKKAVAAQINALDSDMPADAIKLGILPSKDIVESVIKYLEDFKGFVVYDLELENSGEVLLGEAGELVKTVLIPRVNLLVVNVDEAKALTGIAVSSGESLADTASVLLGMGAGSVLVTGAHIGDKRVDLWMSGDRCHWVTIDPLHTANNRGGGNVLSAVMTAAEARGLDIETSLKLAKAYVTQGIRGSYQVGSGPGAVAHLGWPASDADMPNLSETMPVS